MLKADLWLGKLQNIRLLNSMKSRAIIALFILTSWLSACNSNSTPAEKEVSSELNKDSLVILGKEIAKTTFKTLSTHLQNELQLRGIDGAIQYCNINAYPLTDSLSNENNVVIRRVADRYRNENNKMSEEELLVYKEYQSQQLSKPTIRLNHKGKSVFYAPIKLKPMCIVCHGSKEQIGENYDLIAELYPKDKAVGFVPDELRGMWSITFN